MPPCARNGGMRVLMLVVAAVAGAITLTAAMFPQLEFVQPLPAVHVAFETAGALIGLLAGFLIAGRFLRRARMTELALVCSLGVLAVSELAFATVTVGPGSGSRDLTVWAALGGNAIGAILFAVAVFLPDRRVNRRGLAIGGGAALVALTPLVIAALAASFAPHLPGVSVTATGLALQAGPNPGADGVLLRSELGLTMIYGLAAAGFMRHAERSHDEFSGWLAVAAVLAGASHLNYFLYPTMYSQFISVGDVFRLCAYAALLAGSAREISSYWQALPRAAAQEERQRIARDLHDGLTKELGYLLKNLSSIDGAAGTETGEQLRKAAERAQVAARMAISRLGSSPGERVTLAPESAAETGPDTEPRQPWLRLRPPLRAPLRPHGRGLAAA